MYQLVRYNCSDLIIIRAMYLKNYYGFTLNDSPVWGIESQPDLKTAYQQLVDYYFNSKDISSVRLYNKLKKELEINEE